MFIRTFIIIFDALTFFFYRYFFILSIKRTDPVHIYFYIPIYYVFQKVFLLLGNLINKHEFFNVGSEYKWAKYFLDISGDFFCLIGFLIYLEVIQINKWGLNTNLKKYISERCNLENISSPQTAAEAGFVPWAESGTITFLRCRSSCER